MNKNKNKLIILVALEEELPKSMLPELIIEYTGVGKINATYRTLEAIQNYNPETIINFGTAGTLNKNIFGLNEIKIFIQRDMDASKLGFNLGETPFDYISTIKLSEKGLSCGTGDNFVSESPKIKTDLVDMEAYAIAKICKKHKVDFKCYKYISDSADSKASKDWLKNVTKGCTIFNKEVLEKIKIPTLIELTPTL